MSQHWFGRLPTVLRILLPIYLLARPEPRSCW